MGASVRRCCFSFRQLISESNEAHISHLLSGALKSLNERGWPPIGLKTGGIKRYQPTRASAAKSPKAIRRNTQQRREIRGVLELNDRALAADEVWQLAQQRWPGLGMASVYRTIEALTEE